jgi:molybdenum cofactor cytidylyltransferase
MRLLDAFDILPGEVVSIIGAGGKTSLMIGLGYELAESGSRVLATTTVGIDEHLLALVPVALPITAPPESISQALNEQRFVFLYEGVRAGRVQGADPTHIQALLDAVDSDVLLIEADTSNSLPVKAPYEHEPVIPAGTSLVIPVVSFGAYGKPLDEDNIYNARAIIERYGFPEGAPIKSAWLAQILRDETIGLRGVPDRVRVVAFLKQTPVKGYGRFRARVVAQLAMRSARISGVVLGEIRGAQPVYEIQRPVGAVLLAAGASTRMGQHKLLLPWADGRTIIEHIVFQLIKSRVDPIVVVTGHNAREIKALLKPLDLEIVHNKGYKTGEMLSSLKVGLEALPAHTASALVALGDQPGLQPKTIYQLLTAYALHGADLIVPSFQKQRGHPMMIGRRHWPEILNLDGRSTLRDVLNRHAQQIHYVEVDNDSVLRDVDTPQDYRDERFRAGL